MTKINYCFVLSFALCAAVAHPAMCQYVEWQPAQIVDDDTSVITNLHFVSDIEGWAVAYLANKPQAQRGYVRYRTRDGGRTWYPEAIDYDTYWIMDRALFLASDPLLGYASADGGTSLWYDVHVNGHNPGEDNSINSPVRFYESRDGGRSWILRSGAIADTRYFGDVAMAKRANRKYLSAIRFSDSNFGVMTGILSEIEGPNRGPGAPQVDYRGHAFLITQDGGNTWTMHCFGDSYPGDRYPTEGPLGAIRAVAIVDNQSIRILGLSTEGALCFRSDDYGRTWDTSKIGKSTRGVIEFTTAERGWGWLDGSDISFTQDGGRSWTTVDPPGYYICFATTMEGWMVVFTRGIGSSIYHTVDGGTTWTGEYEVGLAAVGTHLSYQPVTRTVWGYGVHWNPGREKIVRRPGIVVSAVTPRSKLATTWGELKRP